ncbi:hypothetical protein ACFL24_02860 [Patescibacteria group bacterium]
MNKRLKQKIKSEQGVSMLFAVLIVSTTLVAALGIGGLMVAELKAAQAVDDSERAYYASEAGIEKALLQLRRNPEYEGEESLTLDNNSKYSYNAVVGGSEIGDSLVKDDSFQINLFDPDDPGADLDIREVEIKWELGEKFGGSDADPWLEITKVRWPKGNISFGDPEIDQKTEKELHALSESPVKIAMDTATYNWRLRIKALYNGAKFEAKAKNADGEYINFPIPLATITSVGKYSNSARGIEVKAQQGTRLLGVFDYVLYSEEEVEK